MVESLRRSFVATALGVALGVLVLPACSSVRARRTLPPESGFLGDYSKLTPREGYEARLVWVDTKADWTKYDAVMIDSVSLWTKGPDSGRLTPEEKQHLANVVYTAIYDKVGEKFTIASRPGPGVLRVRAALTEAKGANVPANVLATFVPQARIISTVVGLSADTAMTVGSATLEAEARDSITGRRLAAAVDERTGNRAIGARAFMTWGDVENAADFWAERMVWFLTKQGVRGKA